MAHEQTLHPPPRDQDDDDEDDSINNIKGEEDPIEGGKGNLKASNSNIGRRKINIEFIEDKGRRHITFSKRKAGIMKKAYELSTLTGTQVLLLVASETGHVYTFSTPKLQPIITKPEGKNLIQACLNAPDPSALPPASPPRHRIAYQDQAGVHGNAASLVPFQGGASSDSLGGSYDEYEKEDKDRRGRLPSSSEKAAQQASAAAAAAAYPSSSTLAAASHNPGGGSSMGGYPPGSYPSSLNHLMSNAQYQQHQQAQAQAQQQQSNLYSQMRYLSQQSGGVPAQQYGAHPSQQGYPPTASGASNFSSSLLNQYQSQGYPYWAGANTANPSEKSESGSNSANHST